MSFFFFKLYIFAFSSATNTNLRRLCNFKSHLYYIYVIVMMTTHTRMCAFHGHFNRPTFFSHICAVCCIISQSGKRRKVFDAALPYFISRSLERARSNASESLSLFWGDISFIGFELEIQECIYSWAEFIWKIGNFKLYFLNF